MVNPRLNSLKIKRKMKPVVKGGRCWNGAHRDRGQVVHAISDAIEPNGYWGGKALCGTEPGSRGYGWSRATKCIDREISDKEVTCEKCLRKINSK